MHRIGGFLLCTGLLLRIDGILGAAEPQSQALSVRENARPAGDALRACLRSWERASSRTRPLTETEQRQVQYRHEEGHSGQELAVVCAFSGPVRAVDLTQDYDWIAIQRDAGQIRLTAQPRDTVARLFFRELRVTLNASTFLPLAIEFSDRAGRWKTGTIELAAYNIIDSNGPGSLPLVADAGPAGRLAEAGDSQIRLAAAATPPPDQKAESVGDDRERQRILGRWKETAAQMRTLEVPFERWIYDDHFEVARQATGTFFFQAPDTFRVDLRPAAPMHPKPKTVERRGRTYKLERVQAESWIVTISRNEILRIDSAGQVHRLTTDGFPLLSVLSGIGEVQSHSLGFMPTRSWGEPLDERFDVTLAKLHGGEYSLVMRPREHQDRVQFGKLSILIDAETYATTAATFVDVRGAQIIAVRYGPSRVNRPWRTHDDPFKPMADGDPSRTDSTPDQAAGNE